MLASLWQSLARVAAAADGLSGGDLREVVRVAISYMLQSEGREQLVEEDLASAVRDVRQKTDTLSGRQEPTISVAEVPLPPELAESDCHAPPAVG